MSTKHPQHILALDKEYTDNVLGLKQGMNHNVSYERFNNEALPYLAIRQRAGLEKNLAFRQILPYTPIIQCEPDFSNQKIFAYQRTNLVGEERLAGKVSVGAAGHIDLPDAIHTNGVIDQRATILNSIGREIAEELIFLDKNGHELTLADTPEHFVMDHYGFLRDDSDDVGQYHLGVINAIFVSPTVTVKCREDELTTLGFFSVKELLASDYNLESWTRILLEDLLTH